MKTSKENIFNIRYTSVLNKKIKRNRTSSKIKNFILNNKVISIAATIFVMCVGVNLVLIYNFLRILKSI